MTTPDELEPQIPSEDESPPPARAGRRTRSRRVAAAPPELMPDPKAAAGHDVDASGRDAGAGSAGEACPFLVSADGGWRAPAPSSEHECAAFAGHASVSRQKQARLCLTPGHATCATYLASTEARTARAGGPGTAERVGRWNLARTTVTLEPVTGRTVALGGILGSRRALQVIPALVLVIAVGALAISRIGQGAAAVAEPTPTPTATAPGATPPPTDAPTLTPTDAPTSAPTAQPVPSPTPNATYSRLYTVVANDTLYDIAIKFHTTVSAIKQLNGLTSNTLHAGEVLKIP